MKKVLGFLILWAIIQCQGKSFDELAYVKTYRIEYPFVMVVKNYWTGYTTDLGSPSFGLFFRDSDGKLIQDISLVDEIKVISPQGTLWEILPQTLNSGSSYPIGTGYVRHGKEYFFSTFSKSNWTYMWYYYDMNLHEGEEGYYRFEAVVKGRKISSSAYFQKFLVNGVPQDPLGTDAPDIAANAYNKDSRLLTWKKVPNAEGYRIYIFEAASMDYSKMIYNSNGTKISNIWNSNPGNPAQVQFPIPADVLLETGKTYCFRVDAYIYTKTIMVQDTNYSHNYRQVITIN